MNLYEMVTTHLGESYVRCYCWAPSIERAHEMFRTMIDPKYSLHPNGVRLLFSADAEEFITPPDDSGFPA